MSRELPKSLPLFVWRFVKQNFLGYSSAIFLIMLSGIAPSVDGYIIKLIIDSLNMLHENLAPPMAAGMLIGLYVAWGCLENLIWRLSSLCMYTSIADLKANIVKEMSAYIITQGHCQGGRDSAGGISHRISEMATGVEQIIQLITESILYTSCLIVFAIFTLASVHRLIAGLLVGWFCVYVGLSYFLQENIALQSQACSANRMSALERLADCITNNQCIKFFSRQAYESQTLNVFLKRTAAGEKKLQRFSFGARFFQDVIWVLFIAAIVGLLLAFHKTAGITIGDCTLVLTLCQTVVSNSSSFTLDISKLSQTIGSCKESLSLITAEHSTTSSHREKPLVLEKGNIEFKNVTFGYSADQPVMKNQSIIIKGGERVGLIGPSGSGKTTFVNLLARLFDPQCGQIFIDGQDIKNIHQDSLHEAMSIVPQVPYLFHRSVRENIAYGKLDASNDEVIAAAKKAQAHEFISELPFGYETVIGEHDISLSYGQCQRIILARAFIRETPIVILDEATSALDGITEFQIQNSLHEFMKNKTTFVIVHKFSTLLMMDRILVFQNGSIIQDDKHENLMLRPQGLYVELLKDQLVGATNINNPHETNLYTPPAQYS